MKKLYAFCTVSMLALTACSLFTKDENAKPTLPEELASTVVTETTRASQEEPDTNHIPGTLAEQSDTTTRAPKVSGIEPGKVVHLEKQNLDTIIKSYDYVVVDFYAEWCQPCKSMSGVLDRTLKQTAFQKVVVIKVDVDKFPDLFKRVNGQTIPHLVFYRKGSKVDESRNSMNDAGFKAKLEALLAK
jgi:thioredoxin 1